MLRREDVNIEELYKLAQDKSVAGRTKLVGRVSELYFSPGRTFSDAERALMTDILRRLVRDVEVQIRQALAKRLADRPNAPKELVQMLANDEIEVARPILTQSTLLDDADLVEVIRLRTMQHRLAIAGRRTVSEPVSEALVERGEVKVVARLLENAGAAISPKTLAFLVEESRRVRTYQRPLLARDELTPELAGRMYLWVSGALRKYILQNFEIDRRVLDESMNDTLTALMAQIRERSRRGGRPVELAEVLGHANALTPEFLIELLREGQVPLFEGLFAELTGLPLETARKLIYQPGGEAFAIACKATRMPKSRFASVFVLSRQARPGEKLVNKGEVPRAIEVFDRVREDVAEAILARWRYDPDYLSLMGAFPVQQFATLEPPPRRKVN